MKYRPEIDGLRALAVVPVIFFHADLPGFHGGYIGVDVFFVISGYLITTILLRDLESGSFSLLKFYDRRARRILPALFAVLIVTTFFAVLWMHPHQLRDYANSLLAVSIFGSNFYFMSASSYFHPAAESYPLLHTWSLAVEEQFYLVFPLLLWALFAWVRGRLFLILALMTVLSLIGSQVLLDRFPAGTFFLLPTRAWELGAGVLCALILARRDIGEKPLLAMLGIVTIVASAALYERNTPFPGIYALPPVIGTVLIILFAGTRGLASRMLRWEPVVYVGLISYSAYLWHQPLFAFARIRFFDTPPQGLMIALGILSLGLAALSLRYIERPFRVSGPGAPQKTMLTRNVVLSASVIVLAAFAAVSVVFKLGDGLPDRWANKIPATYNLENAGARSASWTPLQDIDPSQNHSGGGRTHRWFVDPDRANILIVGDSHSKDMFNIAAASVTAQPDFEIGRLGLGPLDDQTANVIVTTPSAQDADLILIAPRYGDAEIKDLPVFLDTLLAADMAVAIVLNTPEFPGDTDALLADKVVMYSDAVRHLTDPAQIAASLNAIYFDYEDHTVQAKNAIIRAHAQNRGLAVLDRRDLVCRDDARTCAVIGDDFTKYLADYGHPTLAGADFYAAVADDLDWFAPLRAMLDQ